MTTSAPFHGTVDPGRALERARVTLPAAQPGGRALALRAVRHAMPVVARSVAAGMAVIAVEQAVRRFVGGAVERVGPARPVEPAPRPYTSTWSLTETIVIERVRRRR